MRKVFLFMVVSVDGYFEGPEHDISWHMVDDEFNDFAIKQMRAADTLLLGRRTFELFEAFWPKAKDDPSMDPEDHEIAQLMDDMNKVAFSRSGLTTNWQNARVSDNATDEVRKLKEQPGKEVAIFGSNNLCVSLMKDGLVDEFRLMVCPVAIGQGNTLFTGLESKLNLKLVDTRKFQNGNVLLTYQPKLS